MTSKVDDALRGVTVGVIRVGDRAAEVRSRLEARGAEVIVIPSLVIGPPSDDAPLRRACEALDRYDAIALGSVAAAEALAARDPEPFEGPIVCVGSKTRERIERDPVLRSVLAGPLVVPAVHRAEGVLDELARALGELGGRRIFFPRAAEGRTMLVEGLRAAGAEVEAPIAYRLEPGPPLREPDELDDVDAFLVFSGEALKGFIEVVGQTKARARLDDAFVAVIGPVAADKVVELGVRVDAVPSEASAEALVEAVVEWAGRTRG